MADIRKRKWIQVYFSVSSPASHLIEYKKYMKERAKELGWVLVEGLGRVHEKGYQYYDLIVMPDKKGMVSPEKLSKVMDKLIGFAVELASIISPEQKQFCRSSVLSPGEKREDYCLIEDLDGLLYLKYRIMDRLELEKKFSELANVLFANQTVQENLSTMEFGTSWLDRLKKGKDTVARRAAAKKQLLDFFGIKLK